MELFANLPISGNIQKAIAKMGFEEMTPIQESAILPMLEQKDIIAQAPTGTGKTCAFGIPVIENIDPESTAVQALILSPTRELTIQITQQLQKLAAFTPNIRVCPIYGGQQIERQIVGLKKRPQILVATPGRLMDHMRRHTVKLHDLKTVVLDEADEMLNMGFREDIDTILETAPTDRQTALFSATMSREIMDIAKKYQQDALFIKATAREITVPTIEQFYVEVKNKQKADVLARIIEQNSYHLCLVFCNTKSMVDDLTEVLIARGYAAEGLHGDMRQAQRDKVMNKFRQGSVEILVATDVAARGIDVDNIEAVFNYDIPTDVEYYVHRIGRTGRAKKKGVSYSLVTGKDMYRLKDITRYTKVKIQPMRVPTLSDIEHTKTKDIFNQVKELALTENLEKYISFIEDMTEDTDLSSIEIAAAFLKTAMNEFDHRTQSFDRDENYAQSRAAKGMCRLFINLGKLDRIKKGDIINIIASRSGINGRSIGTIDILDKFSFLEVPAADAETVIADVKGTRYRSRKINIEIAGKR